MLLLVTGGMSAWAQTNATSITSGGYYRLYSAAKSKTLYADATNNGVSINQPTAGDNTDVYQLTGSSDNYTILSVGTGKYLNGFTYGNKFGINGKNWVTLNNDAQTFQVKKNASARATVDQSRWIIGSGAAITDDNWFNTNVHSNGLVGGILRWKVDQGDKDGDDVASYFELYQCYPYTLTVTGETGKNVTITATSKNYSSKAVNDGTLYIDATATVINDLTATTDDGYTATVTEFDTDTKTITVNISQNIVGTYKLTPVFSKGAVDGTYYFNLPTTENSSPTLSTSEATVQLIECGKGYILKNGDYYLAYKGGKSGNNNNDEWSLIATTDASKAAVLTISFSDGKIMLNGTNTYSTTGFLCYNDGTAPADGRSLYGDGNPSGTTKAYFAYQWTIAAFTPATTYTRVFEAAQCYTVCLPMAVTTSDVENGTFYELASYSDNTLHFNEVSGTTTAYKPYLFVTSAAGVVLSGDITAYSSQELTTTVSGASMIGTVGSQVLVSGDNTLYGYRASDGTFVQIGSTNGAHINPFRAYISIPGVSEARTLSVTFEDSETTGISTMHNAQCLMHNEVYDLQGRNVSHFESLPKGLYIVNGKKVVKR